LVEHALGDDLALEVQVPPESLELAVAKPTVVDIAGSEDNPTATLEAPVLKIAQVGPPAPMHDAPKTR
jgi:hypothetical protein